MNGSVFLGRHHPLYGTSLGACFVFLKKDSAKSKPGAHGICGRGHDGGFFLEPSRTGSGIFTSPSAAGPFCQASLAFDWGLLSSYPRSCHPHLHQMSTEPEGPVTKLDKTLLHAPCRHDSQHSGRNGGWCRLRRLCKRQFLISCPRPSPFPRDCHPERTGRGHHFHAPLRTRLEP